MQQLQKEIMNAYQDVYENFINSKISAWFEKEAGHFTGMCGKQYHAQSFKLMVVGRAAYGWGQLNTQNREDFAKEAYAKMSREHIEDNMLPKMRSKFWKSVHLVWETMSKQQITNQTDMVANYIAWSNLYKIAPNNGRNKNPNKLQRVTQIESAKKILQAEISFFKPTHILFITEICTKKQEEKGWWSWVEPFIKGETLTDQKKMNGFLDIQNIPGDIIRGKGLYGAGDKIKIVIVTRPDCPYSDKEYQLKWVRGVTTSFYNL